MHRLFVQKLHLQYIEIIIFLLACIARVYNIIANDTRTYYADNAITVMWVGHYFTCKNKLPFKSR